MRLHFQVIIVNLSIINDENLVIKIDSGEYIEEPTIVHDVRHEMLNEVNKLELNNGYKFNNINVEYNDFGNTGFIKEMFEYNINKTILYKQYDEIPNETLLNTTSLDINSLKLKIDDKLFNINEEFDLNEVSTWHLTYDNSTFINSKALKESTCKNILNGKYPYNKICWYEKEISQIDGTVKLLYIAIDPIGCYKDKIMIKNPITYQSTDFNKVDGIVINPAAYTHTSIAILDALKAVNIPCVEVHISDVDSREPFRSVSYVGMVAKKTIKGHGFAGYLEAIDYLLNNNNK